MKSRKIIVILFILFGFINLNLQCRKDFPPEPVYKYFFQEKISVTPYRLNYNVGDTIIFRLNIPGKKLFDTQTNTNVFFDSASFSMGVNLTLLYNNPYIGDGPFASFFYSSGVSAFSQTYTGSTIAFITTGCSHTTDYEATVGVILVKKGVFSIGIYGNDIKNCYNGFATRAQFRLSMDIDDTHKSFYQQLPLTDIGKTEDMNVLSQLDSKNIAIINVE